MLLFEVFYQDFVPVLCVSALSACMFVHHMLALPIEAKITILNLGVVTFLGNETIL